MESDYSNHCNIPPDVFAIILSYLPVKLLLRFRSVSKDWKSIIDNPDFTSLHLSHYANNHKDSHLIVLEKSWELGVPRARLFSHCTETDSYQQTLGFSAPVPENADILASSPVIAGNIDGFLLVQRERGTWNLGDVYLWNPSIRKKLLLPPPPSKPYPIDLCLGFDPSTHDYKVVSILHGCGPMGTYEIFSLKTGVWRYCCGDGSKRHPLLGSVKKKVSYGESVHWVGKGIDEDDDIWEWGVTECCKEFISFNMVSETFSYIQLPYESYKCFENRTEAVIIVSGSLLGLLTSRNGVADIWVLERDQSWSKRFTFDFMWSLNSQLVYLNKDGVLIWSFGRMGETTICSHDIHTGLRKVVELCPEWYPFYFEGYVDSLVLLTQEQC